MIDRDPGFRNRVASIPCGSVHIKGRLGISGLHRGVTGVDFEAGPLKDFDAVILIDSISFSGNTLRIIKEYLVERHGVMRESLVGALLRIDYELKKELESDGWKILAAERHKHKVDGLLCPWGFTRPTQPRLSDEVASPGIPWSFGKGLSAEIFNPKPFFGFLPKPWGELTIFSDNSLGSSRILYFERGHRTSFHYHLLRDEIFFVLDDRLRIQIWDRYVELRRHQALRVPAGVPHSLIALDTACRVLEIAEGPYEARLDIVRLQDIYQRSADEFGDDGLR